jgi:hypothetical protein
VSTIAPGVRRPGWLHGAALNRISPWPATANGERRGGRAAGAMCEGGARAYDSVGKYWPKGGCHDRDTRHGYPENRRLQIARLTCRVGQGRASRGGASQTADRDRSPTIDPVCSTHPTPRWWFPPSSDRATCHALGRRICYQGMETSYSGRVGGGRASATGDVGKLPR